MSNVLKAIINIANNPVIKIKAKYTGRNSINNIGEALEAYIQDAFSGSIEEDSTEVRDRKISKTFSYLGNQNNPPDIMLKNGDAIEVKKRQSTGAIPLNSSYPKNKLHSNDPKILQACKDCEDWESKDMIYAIGLTNDSSLKNIWLIYGDCYAASKEVYSRIGETIEDGINNIPGITLSETKELGRVNRVDPLGITNLRIRGMWNIDHPDKVFKDRFQMDMSKRFNLACIMRETKFNSFDAEDRNSILRNKQITVKDIRIKNPDNPANLVKAKLITLEIV